MKTYNILLIDDDNGVYESLDTFASQFGIAEFDADIIIAYRQNWQDGAELLEKEYFHALILDASCMVDRDQVDDNFDFLTIALERLKEIERKQDRHIPFVINTGYFGEKEIQMMQRLINERKGKIFAKTFPKNEMFQYLIKEIENSENTRIERHFENVFEIWDDDKRYLASSFRLELLNILKNMNDASQNQNIIRAARVIQEGIYNRLNGKSPAIVPNGSFTDKNKHLSGNIDRNYTPTSTVYQTNTISYLANTIYRISSDFGNHPPQKPSNVRVEYWEMPSNYAVQSLVFALLEQLLWFKNLMEKP